MKSWQDNITFVLVEPSEPGNIGSSARAIANMGFKNLALIKPVALSEESYAFAHGAEDILKNALIYDDLKEAVKETNQVFGTSRRVGKKRGLFFSPWDSSKLIYHIAQKNKVALLFGSESRGLLNKETALCNRMIYIPAEKTQPSINLAHSVMIIAYELRRYDLLKDNSEANEKTSFFPKSISREKIDDLLKRIESKVSLLDYPKNDKERKIMQNITNLLSRAGVTYWEEQMIQGLCSQLQKRLTNR
ncbi:MAG TPA: RNA methyltransferase [Nitrospirae bacterium]|nr:RNA methyltransferase [Nitrospirota bacterium]